MGSNFRSTAHGNDDKKQTFIYHPCVIFLSLWNDNMDYTFELSDGRKITEYRPFNLSYAVRNTPCLYDDRNMPYNARSESYAGGAAKPDLLGRLTGQKLAFDAYTLTCLKQLVTERTALRDRNRRELSGRLSDISGYISLCRQLPSPSNYARAVQLDRQKLDLEQQIREEDLTLWRDVSELRRELILAGKQYEAGQIRAELMSSFPHDEHEKYGNPGVSGEMPGFAPYSG
jgi:hypothetical protein